MRPERCAMLRGTYCLPGPSDAGHCDTALLGGVFSDARSLPPISCCSAGSELSGKAGASPKAAKPWGGVPAGKAARTHPSPTHLRGVSPWGWEALGVRACPQRSGTNPRTRAPTRPPMGLPACDDWVVPGPCVSFSGGEDFVLIVVPTRFQLR